LLGDNSVNNLFRYLRTDDISHVEYFPDLLFFYW